MDELRKQIPKAQNSHVLTQRCLNVRRYQSNEGTRIIIIFIITSHGLVLYAIRLGSTTYEQVQYNTTKYKSEITLPYRDSVRYVIHTNTRMHIRLVRSHLWPTYPT